MGRVVDENGYDRYPDYVEPEQKEVITNGNDYSYEDELVEAVKENVKFPVINYHIQNYTCESGCLAKFVIPDNATADDLQGFKELLDIVIKRKFKV